MTKILANDGIDPVGMQMLENAGILVDTEKISQEMLSEGLKNYDGILVRSATKVRKEHIDACPGLKFIGRAGVGMDNIDVEYARSKGIIVANTPSASSLSVAELAMAHLAGLVRFLHDANRKMPSNGSEQFKELKKKYSKGTELNGKTLGIIGLGKIGQETARIAIGMGMNVIAYKRSAAEVKIPLSFHKALSLDTVYFNIKTTSLENVLKNSDFISLHLPFDKVAGPLISSKEFDMMKDGIGLINCARGGVVNEKDLLQALNSGKVAFAGIDVFEEEPTNNLDLLQHPAVSLTPHTGASTVEAQERVGVEMAEKVIEAFR